MLHFVFFEVFFGGNKAVELLMDHFYLFKLALKLFKVKSRVTFTLGLN